MSPDANPLGQRQRMLARKGSLWAERSSWISHYQEISDHILPRAGRYVASDRNRGSKRHNNIYDNTGVKALRVLAAGMMAGMTSPARPWFRLSISDERLRENAAVKIWLNKVTMIMRAVFAKSNTYRALHSGYEELGAFGTAASIVLPDFDTVIHHYPLTAGEYAIATNHKGVVDTLYREFQMTVGQMVAEFGRENCSPTVQNLYDKHALDTWLTVIHGIEPRRDRDTTKLDAKNMPFKSVYFEPGNEGTERMLREAGFKRFPALVSRWVVTGGDVYGTSPGMEALGDIKQLQHEQLRKSQCIDYLTNPPIQVPTAYKGQDVNARLPGGIFYADATGPGQGIRSAFEVQLNLQHLLADIQDVRGRIESAFYADLFLMLSQMDKSGITATEVAERHEEKLLMLGPVLERLHNEQLDPLIDITFDTCMAAGILPDAPEELQGMDINVEFISTLAQAQRAIGAGAYDRLLGTVGNLAALKPDIVDKIDFDQAIDDYGDMYGVNPEIILTDEQVASVRDVRAKQQQAAQMAAAAPGMADAAKTLGDTNVQGVQDVMSQVMGYGTPSPSQV